MPSDQLVLSDQHGGFGVAIESRAKLDGPIILPHHKLKKPLEDMIWFEESKIKKLTIGCDLQHNQERYQSNVTVISYRLQDCRS